MKKIAVVVTYNRCGLLKTTINSLKLQSLKLDEIIIVNNGSTDGTKEYLDTLDSITVVDQTNLGGAGGFNTGIRLAYENKADWIWVMDDDVFPQQDCLEKLFNYTSLFYCLQPKRLYTNGEKINWGNEIKWGNLGITTDIEESNYREFYITNTSCFEGMLISRKIVEEIGFPNPEFFIGFDDTVYGYKIAQITNIAVIDSAILFKEYIPNRKPYSAFYIYYLVRNIHLVKSIALSDGAKISKLFYFNYLLNILNYIRATAKIDSTKQQLVFLKSILLGFIAFIQKKKGIR